MLKTLEDHRREAGFAEPNAPAFCPMCGFLRHAIMHRTVEDHPQLGHHGFVCGNCYQGWHRDCAAIWSQLHVPAPDWSHITERRRDLLNASMWSTATDGTVDPEFQKKMLAWRKEVAGIGPKTFNHPREVVWPAMPEEG